MARLKLVIVEMQKKLFFMIPYGHFSGYKIRHYQNIIHIMSVYKHFVSPVNCRLCSNSSLKFHLRIQYVHTICKLMLYLFLLIGNEAFVVVLTTVIYLK